MTSKINEKVVKKGADLIRGLLMDVVDELDVAYINSDGNTGVRVALFVKFSAGKSDTMGIDAGIDFVESRIKDGASAFVNPNQDELPFEEPKQPERTTYLWQEHMSTDPRGCAYIHYEKAA